MALLADEGRDEGKEVDDGRRRRRYEEKGEEDEETGPGDEAGDSRTVERKERGNEKEMKKRTERDGLSSFAYLLHYSE